MYVKDPDDINQAAGLLSELDGVAQVLDADGKTAHGLDHERSGELVVIADPDA